MTLRWLLPLLADLALRRKAAHALCGLPPIVSCAAPAIAALRTLGGPPCGAARGGGLHGGAGTGPHRYASQPQAPCALELSPIAAIGTT